MTRSADGSRLVVVGSTPEARRTCAELAGQGIDVVALELPTDDELAAVLASGADGLAVLLHDDTEALRYCLSAEHARPGIPQVVALFDRTAAQQLVTVVPGCRVTSPADIALPSLVAGALTDDLAGVVRTGDVREGVRPDGMSAGPFVVPPALRRRARLGLLLGQLRPHDSGSRILLAGLAGLVGILALDTLLGSTLLHEPLVTALHRAVGIVATVGPAGAEDEGAGYLLFASVAMLATIGLTAMFTAGIVEHLLSGRLVGLWGRRVLPRRGHVVVVGMGQVGVRLSAELRALGLGVVGIERFAQAPHLSTARALGVPVLIGDASRRRVLERAGVDRAVALVAVGSSELDNVAVAVTARAVAPDLRVVLRAGNHDVIAETRSLFRIGRVCDVTGLTAAFTARCLTDQRPRAVLSAPDDEVLVVLPRDGAHPGGQGDPGGRA